MKDTYSLWRFESALVGASDVFAGVDEVGRGCIAGPVVAAAVVRPDSFDGFRGVYDSKTLSAARREEFYTHIIGSAKAVGVGYASVEEVDALNILQATRRAMTRAVRNLGLTLDLALVDGLYSVDNKSVPCLPVVDGDARCSSIAAASIVAKVSRDRYMARMAETYPAYGFERHVGYGTKEHLDALRMHGITPLHRRSFAPVRTVLQALQGG